MSGKFSRSWELVKASGKVLQQDKELMVFPLLSTIAMIIIVASFALPLITSGTLDRMADDQDSQVAMAIYGFLFYLVQYFIIFFFNAALVGAAMIRLEGGDPTVSDGLRIATSKLIPILGYAAIAATVGLILRVIEERAGFIGKWIAGLLGIAFTVATFLAVPILVSRDVGPIEAVKESAGLLKETWGENIIGNAGLGIVFFLIYAAAAIVGAGIFFAAAVTGSGAAMLVAVVAVVIAFALLALIHASLQGVYAAALYRFATTGEGVAAFDTTLMQGAFRAKR